MYFMQFQLFSETDIGEISDKFQEADKEAPHFKRFILGDMGSGRTAPLADLIKQKALFD